MARFHLTALACLASATWMGTATYSLAQDSKQGTQNPSQQDSQQSRDNRQQHQSQPMADEEETEFRGMEHAALGVMLSERQGQGVRIRDVLPDSPADHAGLRPGDQIQKIDDKQMNTYVQVIRFVNRVQPGQAATISVRRNGEDKNVRVTFATREQVYGHQQAGFQSQQQRGDRQFSGQQAGNWEQNDQGSNNQQRFAQLNQGSQQNRWSYHGQQTGEHGILGIDLENQSGAAVIRDVRAGSPAQQAGLRRGDEIVAIDNQSVQDRQDVMDDLHDRKAGERVSLTIYRNGRERNLQARLSSEQELNRQASRDRGQTYQDGGRNQTDRNRDPDQSDRRDNNNGDSNER